MRARKRKRPDIGFVFWVISMMVILSLTIYRYLNAVHENRVLWNQYRAIETEIENLKRDMEFIERESR